MSTPEIAGSSAVKNKYSPFGCGINRSLLTPCRQVGLSRKRKTSLNKSVKSSENLSTSSNDISGVTDDTTPLAHSKFSSERTKNRNQFISSQTTPTPNQESATELSDKPKISKLPKKDLLQTFTSEDIFDANEDQIEESKENKIVLPETEVCEKKDGDGKQTLKRRNSKTFKKRRLSSFSYSSLSDNSDNDFVQSNSDLKCSKSISKISLHILDSNSSQSDNSRDVNCAKKCKVELHKLSDNEIKRNNSRDNNMGNTLKKKYSSSIDDADFFTSTPEEEKTKRKSLEKKIVVLENQIKQKKPVLENLERASIYKSKHNIPELKRLTSLWLGGCVQALKDLLTHLQAHGPIDLTTLLNNMQIPKEIVAKLPL